MLKRFLHPLQVQLQFQRCRSRTSRPNPNKNPIYKKVGNGQRFGCITYYPREDGYVLPKIENPPKVFRVQRIKPLKGRAYWERNILRDLGLVFNMGQEVAIVKNTPEINCLLWKIKHLISVEPIYFPYGEPTENDINHTYLTDCGDCLVTKELAIDPKRIEAADKFIKDPVRLDKDTLKRDALLKWNRCY